MRRLGFIALLAGLVLAAGCGKKDSGPQGPFVPLVERLPTDAPLVVMLDIAGLFKLTSQAEQELKQLPIMAKHPELLGLVEEQIAIGRASLMMLQAKMGMDPSKDLTRAVVALMLPPDGRMDLVAVVEGKFPPDFFARMFPGAKPEKVAGQDVYPSPGEAKLALVDGRFLVAASPQRMPASLTAQAKAAEKLAAHHPGLFKAGAKDSLLRVSLDIPAEIAGQLELVPGAAVFAGVEHVYLDAGAGIELAATCADDRAVDHVRAVLEAMAELLAGGQHMIRGLGYWLLMLDLDGADELDGLPPVLAPAIADREALLATLEKLFPEPSGAPPVSVDGRRVALVTDRKMLKGAGLLIGLGAALAVPALMARQRFEAEDELERALEEAERFDGKGGVK